MQKKLNIFLTICAVLALITSIAGFVSRNDSDDVDHNVPVLSNSLVKSQKIFGKKDVSAKEYVPEEVSIPVLEMPVSQADKSDSSEADKPDMSVSIPDLEFSDGLEFESNHDGTCTLVGIGVCTDTDIVIPTESPDGDTVTLIDKYAFMSLEDVNSVSLVNYNYEIDKFAFQYGEFETLNIIGGNPVIKGSAFFSCENLTSVLFYYCNLQIDDDAFMSCGKNASIIFSDCTGSIGKKAFQYSELESLAINNCSLEINQSAFSSCEELTAITFIDSTIETDTYAFFDCGDTADVIMNNCSVVLEDKAFQYSSLNSLLITGPKLEICDSVFSNCEDLTVIEINCPSAVLGEYAFFNCEDLTNVSICDNAKSNNEIQIDDAAFQYCEKLENVIIGDGSIVIEEGVFLGCPDNLPVSIAGNIYAADKIQEGFKK